MSSSVVVGAWSSGTDGNPGGCCGNELSDIGNSGVFCSPVEDEEEDEELPSGSLVDLCGEAGC